MPSASTFSPAMRIGSWRALTAFSTFVIAASSLCRLRGRHGSVVEGVEVAKRGRTGQVRQLSVDDERNLLLGQAAMRTQRLVEGGQVVPVFRRSDGDVLTRHHDDVAD